MKEMNEILKNLKECINTFRKRLGNKLVDRIFRLIRKSKYEELVENYLIAYYDPLYMHSIEQYKYNKVIDFKDINETLEELMDFHKTAVEGAIKC